MGNQPLLERIKEHQQLVAEVVRLQAEVDRQRPAALTALPASFGYSDMDSFIRAVIKACRQPRQKKSRARKPQASAVAAPAKVEIGGGMAKFARATQSVTEPPRPSGTSLDDPKNFGLLPDQSLLESTGSDIRIQQGKLIEALKFAQQVLHTSGVQAAVWREWRQFEHKASELLRSLNAVTRTEE
jgi:hypothetical protein